MNESKSGEVNFEQGINDPRNPNWGYDPARQEYLEDPYKAYEDIEIWATNILVAYDRIIGDAEIAKTPEQIEHEDIRAVLKSISLPDKPAPLGQQELELTPNLDALVAWGSAMKARTVPKETLNDLSSLDVQNVGARNLRFALLGRKRGPTTYDHVGMQDPEYSRMFISPTTLKNRTEARTRAANQSLPYGERLDKADRARVHVHDRVADNIDKLIQNVGNELMYLNEVKGLVGGFRFAKVDFATLQSLQIATWELSFKLMVDKIATNSRPRWTAEEYDRAERALSARLFHGPQHVKTRYWNQMVDLAIDYAEARKATLISNKIFGRRIMKPAS